MIRIPDLDKGVTRLAAVESIDAALDLCNGFMVANYETEVKKFSAKVNAYNTALCTLDDLHNDYVVQLQVLKDWNKRVLTGVVIKYGKNSSLYEMAGGVKKSERKKTVRKAE